MNSFCMIVFFIIVLSLLGCGHKVVISKDLETMPREIALNYLQNESAKYVSSNLCIYTNTGIEGTPYSELEYYIDEVGNWMITIWKKGKIAAIGFVSDPNLVCSAVKVTYFNDFDYSDQELDDAMNKAAAALSVLGVKRAN